ncbi:hypothetical protein E2P81_ATG09099 [Venturia nashicola]|nr:hypothetical protein E2P81_ATG09099 [Venturia nashicola]
MILKLFMVLYPSTCINVVAILELTYHELAIAARVPLQLVSSDLCAIVSEWYGVASDCARLRGNVGMIQDVARAGRRGNNSYGHLSGHLWPSLAISGHLWPSLHWDSAMAISREHLDSATSSLRLYLEMPLQRMMRARCRRMTESAEREMSDVLFSSKSQTLIMLGAMPSRTPLGTCGNPIARFAA